MTAFLVVLYVVAFAIVVFTAIAESRRKDYFQNRSAALTEQCGRFSQKLKATNELLKEFEIRNAVLAAELEEAETRAATDGLTSLPNRRELFDRQFPLWVSRAQRDIKKETTNHPFCTIMIDLDHFKAVNDTHGHLAGDRVLRAVANVVREHLRASDLPARYGGEELIVVLPDTPQTGAIIVAESIRKAISELRIRLDDGSCVSITVSIGVSQHFLRRNDDHKKVLMEQIRLADAALYHAKGNGRNQVVPAAILGQKKGVQTSVSPLKIVK